MKLELRLSSIDQLSLILPFVRSYHAFESLETTEAGRESAVRKLLANPDLGGIWLIHVDDEPAGYIVLCRGYSLEFCGFDAFIDEFFLDVEFRQRGVGSRVLELMKDEAKKLEIKALHLEVARDNDPARRLYGRAGFRAREKYVLMSIELEESN